ncbi:MAG: serine/threonine-protein kinase [Ignavibacteriota bacterium]
MSESFGRYTVISQLGRGAMGVVYLASDPVLNRQVAVKTVDLAVEEPEEREFLRSRLFRDARAAAVLKHSNIVAIYDVFEDAGRAYVVMEYIEGESLAATLKRNPLPDVSGLLKVLGQMADALDYTHARGVIHRDIKPANVMIDSTGTTKIMDFGIARMSDTRTCTPTGMVMGTVEYMAPEQILGETVDGRADQFALAVVAYQMMTGSTLYGPNSVATLTYKIVNEAPPLPCARNTNLPRSVDAVLGKALSKKPADRFATCTEFVRALATAFSDAPTAPVPTLTAQTAQTTVAMPPPASAAEVAPGPSSKAPVIAAAVAVLLLGGALAAVIWKPRNRFPTLPAANTMAVTTPASPPATAPAETTPVPSVPHDAAPAAPADTAPKATDPPKVDPAPKQEPASPIPSSAPAAAPMAAEPAAEIDFSSMPRDPKMKGGVTPFSQAMQRGQQQVRATDYVSALRSFGDAVALRPDSAPAHFSRGAAFQHLEQFEAAMRDYRNALRIAPQMVQAHVQLGDCLVQLHRDPEALVEFQRALELNPGAILALFGRANIHMRRREFAAALTDYNHVLQIAPRFAPAYQNRAAARQMLGDMPGALADRRVEQSLHK